LIYTLKNFPYFYWAQAAPTMYRVEATSHGYGPNSPGHCWRMFFRLVCFLVMCWVMT